MTDHLVYPPSWEKKGDPIVVGFFKKLIASKLLFPDLDGRLDCVDLIELFEKSSGGKKLPANWITSANLMLGYTDVKGEPYTFCICSGEKGDCFFGYTLLSAETLKKQRQR